jgi:hypothetical protein
MGWKTLILTVGLSLLIGCGDQSPYEIPFTTLDVESSRCQSGQALLLFFDNGWTRPVCGCSERYEELAGERGFGVGEELVCTIPVGATVVFHFVGVSSRQQVISEGPPSFPSSGIFNPEEDRLLNRNHAFTFSNPGEYRYFNLLSTELRGKIIVQ